MTLRNPIDSDPPCGQCPSMAICRVKVKDTNGTNMWNKLWAFTYVEGKACELLSKYINTDWEEISIKEASKILVSMRLLHKDNYE